MVIIRELAHVVELLESYAGAKIVGEALRAAGLDRSVLSLKAGFAPYASEGILVERVARMIGDRHLGARAGRDFDYSKYGAYSSYVLSAPDLASALERGARAFLLIHPGSEIVFRRTGTHIVAGRNTGGLTVVGRRHLDEGTLFVIATVVRHFLGESWRPDWVELPPDPSTDLAQLECMLGAPVHTRDGAPGVAVLLKDLQALNPSTDGLDSKIRFEDLAALMGVSPVQTIEDAVEQILQITIASADISEDTVARHLAIGSRTLQRALRQEGTSFSDVQSRFMKDRAQRLLSQTDKSVEEIATSLGYRDSRSFRRAFNRWTGISPSRHRSQKRSDTNPAAGGLEPR